MPVLFGRTFFGGPLSAGRSVPAEGTAACGASASGRIHRHAPVWSADTGGGSAAGGRCERVITARSPLIAPQVLIHDGANNVRSAGGHVEAACPQGTEVVSMTLVLDFRVQDYRQATYYSANFTTAAAPVASFILRETLPLSAVVSGEGVKTHRLRPAGRVLAEATLVGDADLFALAAPLRCTAYAQPFGTWFYVSRGTAQGLATLAGEAVRTRQVSGESRNGWTDATPDVGLPEVTLELDFRYGLYRVYDPNAEHFVELIRGDARIDPSGRGVIEPAAVPFAEPALARGGATARELDASGRVMVAALASTGVVRTHPVSLSVGRGRAVALHGERTRRGRGRARGYSQCAGDAQLVVKAEGFGRLVALADVTGTCLAIAGGISWAYTRGVAVGTAGVRFNSTGQAQAVARPRLRRQVLDLSPPAVQARATVAGGAWRMLVPIARGVALALVLRGKARMIPSGAGSATCRGLPDGWPVFWPKVEVSGTAECRARVSGFNNVNSAARAPASRTVAVAADARGVAVPRQDRRVTVGQALRALAA